MKWGHWIVDFSGKPELQLFPEEPRFTSEPSLSRPVGKAFEIHANNRGKLIADLERIYQHELPGASNEEAA